MRKLLELKVPPLLLCLILLLAMGGLKAMTLGARWVLLPLGGWATGIVVAALGLLVMGIGAWQFRRQDTTLDPRFPERTRHVVSDGIYRFTRNPMYLGMALGLLGVAIALSNLLCLAVVAVFYLYISEMQIKPEERWLVERFGDGYRSYMARVRRWV